MLCQKLNVTLAKNPRVYAENEFLKNPKPKPVAPARPPVRSNNTLGVPPKNSVKRDGSANSGRSGNSANSGNSGGKISAGSSRARSGSTNRAKTNNK